MIQTQQPAWGMRLRPPIREDTATTEAFGLDRSSAEENFGLEELKVATDVLVALCMVKASPTTDVSLGYEGEDVSRSTTPCVLTVGISEDQVGIAMSESALAGSEAYGLLVDPISVRRRLGPGDAWFAFGGRDSEQSPVAEEALLISGALDPKIQFLIALPDNWNSYGAPAPTLDSAIKAQRVLTAADTLQVAPRRVVASAEGGIAIVFSKGRQYADVEVLNSGVVLAVISEQSAEPDVWEVGDDEIDQTLLRIRDFLRA